MKLKGAGRILSIAICFCMIPVLLPDKAVAVSLADNPEGSTLDSIGSGGEMGHNDGTVRNNEGWIYINSGTVERNSTLISSNYGTVNENHGIIGQNYGTVDSNNSQVTNFGGTVKENNGTVITYRKVSLSGADNCLADEGLESGNGNRWIRDTTGEAIFTAADGWHFAAAPVAKVGTVTKAGNGYKLTNVTADTQVILDIRKNLTFEDSDNYNVAEGRLGTDITPVDVSGGVSGGKAPYTFSKVSGPDWLTVSAAGTISGLRPAAETAATTAVIKVIDSDTTSGSRTITIAVGAVLKDAVLTPAAADYDKYTAKSARSFELDSGSHSLLAVKNGETALSEGTDYIVSGSLYTIRQEYLNKEAVGKLTLTFDMSGGTDPTAEINITDTTPIVHPIIKDTGNTGTATGDDSQLILWICAALITACTGIASMVLKRRRKQDYMGK